MKNRNIKVTTGHKVQFPDPALEISLSPEKVELKEDGFILTLTDEEMKKVGDAILSASMGREINVEVRLPE